MHAFATASFSSKALCTMRPSSCGAQSASSTRRPNGALDEDGVRGGQIVLILVRLALELPDLSLAKLCVGGRLEHRADEVVATAEQLLSLAGPGLGRLALRRRREVAEQWSCAGESLQLRPHPL